MVMSALMKNEGLFYLYELDRFFPLLLQPETIPQGIIDMNKCSAVNDAETVTSHPFSLEIVTPNKKYYIKGQSKEEYQW